MSDEDYDKVINKLNNFYYAYPYIYTLPYL